jgi:hypothetical protein
VGVPNVAHVGLLPADRGAFIVMDYLKLEGAGDQAELGRQLARMHAAAPLVGGEGRFEAVESGFVRVRVWGACGGRSEAK